MKRFSFLTTCSLCLAFSQAVQAQFFTYEIESMTATDIGTLGGEEASAMDINDLGQMTGWAMLADGTSHAFLYSNGSMVDVTPSFATMKSMGRGINNNAEIVGKYDQPVGNTIVYKPFYWSQYEVTPKTLAMVGGFTEAIAINDNGLIVGGAYGDWGDACGFKSYAVRWQNAYLPIEKLYCPGFNLTITRATDVNNAGAVSGFHNQDSQAGWVWTDANSWPPYVPPLAEPTCKSWAHGLNASGDVAGMVETCAVYNKTRAIFWDGVSGTSRDLGFLPGGERSDAREVNDQKFVAGYSEAHVLTSATTFATRDRAFIWHTHFGMKALPIPPGVGAGAASCRAWSLNNRIASTGLIQVVGLCTVNGKSRAVRWNVVVRKKLLNFP